MKSYNIHDIETARLLVVFHNLGVYRLSSIVPMGTGGGDINFWEVVFSEDA